MTQTLMRTLIVMLAWSIQTERAEGSSYRTVRIGKRIAPLLFQKASPFPFAIELSPGCTSGTKCQALLGILQLQETKLRSLRLSTRGGKNPGAGLCKNALKGHVVIGILPDGSHDSLCRFRDGSLAANSSILAAFDYLHRPSR